MTDYQSLAEFRFQLRNFLHASEQRVLQIGLEPQQHQLMLHVKALSERERPTVMRLAERLLLRHHSVVGLIDRLEARGLVRRVKDTVDQRRVVVELTVTGETLIQELTVFHELELSQRGPQLLAALQAVVSTAKALDESDNEHA